MTVKLSHDRNVRSLAKKTLGSTRVGRAMRLPMKVLEVLVSFASASLCGGRVHVEQTTVEGKRTLGGLEEGL